jgi:hypothetical protein
MKKKKRGKIGLMEMLRPSPHCSLWENGAKICEEWQEKRLELELITFIIKLVSLASSLDIFLF